MTREDSTEENERLLETGFRTGVKHPLVWSIVITIMTALAFAILAWVVFNA